MLWLSTLDCAVNPSSHCLLDGYRDALALRTFAGATFKNGASGGLIVDVGDFQIYLRNAEELYILREILVEQVYEFSIPGPAVVWDIGMNVGIASLFFAHRKKCPVYAYELSATTFKCALENLALNNVPTHEIRPYNLGIGAKDEEVQFVLDTKERGTTSKVPSRAHFGPSLVQERGQLADCTTVLNQIIETADGREIVAKIDCEGSEYEIIDALCDAGLIRELSLLMIEWHPFVPGRKPQDIVTQLTDHGFSTVAPGSFNEKHGLIYATRR
ncbi:MAG: FkbM family methyltransferase [Pirellulales bacterium]